MGHPLIDEFCRANTFRPDFLRRCQQVFREEINPALGELEVLRTENAELKAKATKAKPQTDPAR